MIFAINVLILLQQSACGNLFDWIQNTGKETVVSGRPGAAEKTY